MERAALAHEPEGGPIVGVGIGRILLLQETTLSGTQGLDFALSFEETAIKVLHELAGAVIFNRPEANDERGSTSGQEGTPKTKLFITTTRERESSFTAAQSDELARGKSEAEGVEGGEGAVSQQDRGEIGSIKTAIAVSSEVDDGATSGIL